MSAPIALALSGGGVRAMAFHLGVLRRLAELKLFERVRRISTVSGGSLLVGLVYRSSNFSWPSSEHFIADTYPTIENEMCSRSLQLGAFSQLLKPCNFRYFLSRANLLALELRQNWGMDVPLSRLSTYPEWSINGTTAENGKRFRFKGSTLGDWDLGYASCPDFPLSDALAISAAFPVGFGPLAISVDEIQWYKREWDAAPGAEKLITLPFKRLHLYDGGLYDNLGAESFFDTGKQKAKYEGDYIIVSDAGAPFIRSRSPGALSVFRLKRMMDIMSEQCRSLRIRTFYNYLRDRDDRGALLIIGTPVSGPSCPEAEYVRSFPTSLKRLNKAEFTRIAQHGYAVACEHESRRLLG